MAIRLPRVLLQEGSESPEANFLDILIGSDFEARRHFLKCRFSGKSIMDVFQISRNRLREPNGKAWRVMNFIATLETDNNIVDFRKFFYNRTSAVDQTDFQDYTLPKLVYHRSSVNNPFWLLLSCYILLF